MRSPSVSMTQTFPSSSLLPNGMDWGSCFLAATGAASGVAASAAGASVLLAEGPGTGGAGFAGGAGTGALAAAGVADGEGTWGFACSVKVILRELGANELASLRGHGTGPNAVSHPSPPSGPSGTSKQNVIQLLPNYSEVEGVSFLVPPMTREASNTPSTPRREDRTASR